MKRLILVALVFAMLGFAASASAQTPANPGNKIGWDQPASALAEAQGYTYKYYADAGIVGVTLTPVACTGTASPFQCEVAFPAFTPGAHTLALTASNTAGESVKSAPLAFTFVVIPSAPTSLRIK
jgi:hypothetical protein